MTSLRLALLLVVLPTTLRAAEIKLAVLPAQFDESAAGMVPDLFDDYLLTAVQNAARGYRVIGQQDIAALLGFEQQKDLLDCSDTSCMADIGGALGVDKLVVVKIARLSEDWVMTAKLIDIKGTQVESRVTHMANGDVKALLQAVEVLVAKLFGKPVPATATAAPPRPAALPSAARPAAPPPVYAPPPAATTPPPPAPLPRAAGVGQAPAADTGWALAAGILGMVATGGIVLFTTGSALTTSETGLSIGLGANALLIMTVFTPLTFVGARSARNSHPDVHGVLALRIIGWIAYGLAEATGVALIALGALDAEVPPEAIVSAGVLGVVSVVCMSIDAFVARSQAKGLQKPSARLDGEDDGVRVIPLASVALDRKRNATPVLGLGMTF